MALKAFDGFGHYKQAADFLSRSNFLQWQILSTAAPTISFPTGLTGYDQCLSLATGTNTLGQTSWLRAVFGDRNQEFYLGFRFKGTVSSGGSNGSGVWLGFYDTIGAAAQFCIHFDETNYAVEVYQGSLFSPGALLGASANNVWMGGVGFFAEIHAKVDSSAGAVEVKVDGVSVLSLTGLDNQSTANAWADALNIMASPKSPASTTVYFDDFYYCDTVAGPGTIPCDTFLGDCRVATVFATGNDVVQFTPLANANWQEISETAMDSDVSYNYDSVAGDQDTFDFQPIENTLSTIFGLQLTYATRKDDAGAHTIAGVVKIGGTSYPYGSPNSVPASSTYTYFSDLWILSPATGLNFTRTEINGAALGYKLVT